jgi:hypothetical protein
MPNLRWLCTPLPCALILCLANVFKPPVIDDVAYLWYVRQIQQTPQQPFGPPPDGFALIWYYEQQGAFSLLTPMVVPYWLAIGATWFGENIPLLKLWLFPFCWLFTASLYSLLRRFAPGWERPLLIMTVLSPTILPSVNLMIDLPALALALSAIVLFFRAIAAPKTNYFNVVLSGLVAGLAAQTKYNAAVAAAAIFWAGICHRRKVAGLVALLLAIGVFASWELYLKSVYGQSHFLYQIDVQAQRFKPPALDPNASATDKLLTKIEHFLDKKANFIAPLFGYLGGLLSALALLAATALRVPGRFIRWGALFVALGFVLMATVPNTWAVYFRDEKGQEEVTLGTLFISITGAAFAMAGLAVAWYLGFRGWSQFRIRLRRDPATWFLIGWAMLEIAGYFVLSPFAAARRVMGFVVAVTLMIGRLLARTSRAEESRARARIPIILGIALGIFFGVVDFLDAFPENRAATAAVQWIRSQPGGDGRIWYAGHWGFQYAAEKAGAKPIYPDHFELEPGDWVILPEGYRPYAQEVILTEDIADLKLVMAWGIDMGVRTIPEYYCGYMPMRHHEGPRVTVRIYRMTR